MINKWKNRPIKGNINIINVIIINMTRILIQVKGPMKELQITQIQLGRLARVVILIPIKRTIIGMEGKDIITIIIIM